MRLTQFGVVSLPRYNEADRHQLSADTHLVPMRGGAFDAGGGGVDPNPDQISSTFRVRDITEATLDAIKAEALKGTRILRAETLDGLGRQTFAKYSGLEYGGENHDFFETVTLTWDRPYPYWLDSRDEMAYLDDGLLFDGTWYLSAGHVESETVNSNPYTFTISNGGGARVPRGLIRIEPDTGGEIVDPRIDNLTNGMWMRYTGTLTDSDVLEIDLLAQECYLNSSPAGADFYTPNTQMEPMILELGDNSIRVSANSFTADVLLYWWWSRHYG